MESRNQTEKDAVLVALAEKGDIPALKKHLNLMYPSTDIDSHDDNAALLDFIKSNSETKVRSLLEKKADPNHATASGDKPLHLAVKIGSSSGIVKLLLNFKAVPNERDGSDFNALHHAAQAGNVLAVAALLKSKAAFNRTTPSNETPLHLAAAAGSSTIVRFLLNLGATCDSRDRLGNTPLMKAARADSITTQVLLEANADPTLRNSSGETALHAAVKDEKQPASHRIQTLLQANSAIVNVRDNHGETALFGAARAIDALSIESLLEAKADPTIKNLYGWDALSVLGNQNTKERLVTDKDDWRWQASDNILQAGYRKWEKDHAEGKPMQLEEPEPGQEEQPEGTVRKKLRSG